MSGLPSYAKVILRQQGLQPKQVLRHGPRYLCVMVSRGERQLFFKQLLLPEQDSDYDIGMLRGAFRRETKLLGWLSDHAFALSLLAPRLLAAGEGDNPWYLRELIPGQPMSDGGTDFIFARDFFDLVQPEVVVHAFESLHALASKDRAWLETELDLGTYTLREYADGTHWQVTAQNREHLTPYASKVDQFLQQAQPTFDRFMTTRKYSVLGHHEPYPSHLFVLEGRIGLIDWENVGWTNRVQDLSKIWLRSFDAPKWQQRFEDSIRELGYFENGGWTVWQTELLLQCIANTGYVMRSHLGTSEYRERAVEFFAHTIGRILRHNPAA